MAKVIINKVLPLGKKYYAINLFGVIFSKGPCDRFTLNHEEIHTAQMKELLYLGFYIWYVVEWIGKSLKYKGFSEGYRNISFEREAYKFGDDLTYLAHRPRFAFLKSLKP